MSSETASKRNLSQIQPVQTKRQEMDEEAKKMSKPGRKPINSEPKNKRTAQNRAAQRAFRERKEKKMKELEDKVKELENEKKAANTESEFLRMQVEMLSNELTKYRGSTFNVSSLKLDKGLLNNYKNNKRTGGNNNNTSNDSSQSPNGSSSSIAESTNSGASEAQTPLTSSSNTPDNSKNTKHTFEFPEFPWSNLKMNLSNSKHSTSYSESSNSYKGDSSLSPGSDAASSTDSPSDQSNNNNNNNSKLSINAVASAAATNSNREKERNYNFDKNFDESNFCSSLGLACGTRDKPMPQFPHEQQKDNSLALTNSGAAKPRSQKNSFASSGGSFSNYMLPNNIKNNSIAGNNSEGATPNDFLAFFNSNINNNTNNNMNASNEGSYDPNLAFSLNEPSSNKLLDDLDFLKDPSSNMYRESNNINNDLNLFDGLGAENELNLDNFNPINELTTDELSYDPFKFNNNNSNRNTPGMVSNPDTVNSYNSSNNNGTPASDVKSAMAKYIDSAQSSPVDFFSSDANYDASKLGNISDSNQYGNNNNNTTNYNNNIMVGSAKNSSLIPDLDDADDEVDEDDENAMVPAKEEKYLKCSEIWDRVTSHPKYTELDIDGLCSELRTKAKCSDKGVVLETDDFNQIFQKASH